MAAFATQAQPNDLLEVSQSTQLLAQHEHIHGVLMHRFKHASCILQGTEPELEPEAGQGTLIRRCSQMDTCKSHLFRSDRQQH